MTSNVSAIPEGFHTVTPYFIVAHAAELIEFLQTAFGAVEDHRSTTAAGRIMHSQLTLGDSKVMLGEAREEWPAMPASIYLYVEDTDRAYRQALAAGGTPVMEPSDQFYGDRNAGVKDPSGNIWWIATRVEEVSPEELQHRLESLERQQADA